MWSEEDGFSDCWIWNQQNLMEMDILEVSAHNSKGLSVSMIVHHFRKIGAGLDGY